MVKYALAPLDYFTLRKQRATENIHKKCNLTIQLALDEIRDERVTKHSAHLDVVKLTLNMVTIF